MIPSAPGNVFGAAPRTAFLVSGNVMPITDIREIGLTRGGQKAWPQKFCLFSWTMNKCSMALGGCWSAGVRYILSILGPLDGFLQSSFH